MTAIPESRPELLLRDLMLTHPGITVATAESCTGGGIAARLTSVDGSSAYVLGGVIAYSNPVKHQLLGVPTDVLENPGAVSEACAAAMAEGAREAIGSRFAVSSTGIAGPTGGTARKPVGLVYLGITGPGGTRVEQHQFPGDRGEVVQAATQRALEMVLDGVQAFISTGAQ